MARISLQEQYENKDVIQQIYGLKDDVNRVSETTENIKDDVNAVSRTAEEAKTLAQQTSDKVEEVGTLSQQTANKVEEVETLAQQASDTADTAVTTIQGTVTSGSIVADTVSAKLKLNKVSGASEDSVIPIASASQTGMMNAQTYAGITNLNARISALEGKNTTVYVTFPNDDPDQSIITSTFQTKAGRPPTAGDYATDITRNLTYGYDGSVWVKVDSDVPIPQFSLDTPGLIKGNDADGTVFAEADGTGSIKGWDALKQSVQNNSTAIAQNSTAIAQNSTAIGQNRTAIASKLDKNAGIENAGKFVKVGDDGEIALSKSTNKLMSSESDLLKAHLIFGNTTSGSIGTSNHVKTKGQIWIIADNEFTSDGLYKFYQSSGVQDALMTSNNPQFTLESLNDIIDTSSYNGNYKITITLGNFIGMRGMGDCIIDCNIKSNILTILNSNMTLAYHNEELDPYFIITSIFKV